MSKKYVPGIASLFYLTLFLVGACSFAGPVSVRQEMLCQRDNIREIMRRVVAFQTRSFDGEIVTDWLAGTFYSGVYAAYQATEDKELYDAARVWCEAAGWKLSGSYFFADDICAAQTFLDIYSKDKQPHMIADVKSKMEKYFDKNMISKREAVVSLWSESQRPFTGRNVWWWCDSLYMAPPVLARMYSITGDKRYLDVMHKLYWDTKEYLFDRQEGLFFRDERYFKAKTPNGRKVFWGRGNGWVYAGLMRMIDLIPDDDPHKIRYVRLYLTLTRAIIKYQQSDGLWRASLNDPEWLPVKETSSTSFFCYGLLAGINKGYLDKKAYLPVALKAWEGLLDCIDIEGRLGYVQLADIQPNEVRPDDFVDYTHGAFLLAASELYKMNLTSEDILNLRPPHKIKQISKNGGLMWFNGDRAIIDGQALLVGSLDSNGYSGVDQYTMGRTNGSYAYVEYPLSSWKSKDDHNYPALLKLGNGQVLTCYSKHHSDKTMYYRLADKKGYRYNWGSEKKCDLPESASYNNLCRLSSEKNRIYNFSRNTGFNTNVQYSDDNAGSWKGPFVLIKSGDNGTVPYIKYTDNGKDRIDFLYNCGHLPNGLKNNIYHIYYKAGYFYTSDGIGIKSFQQVKTDPLAPSDGTLVYDGRAEGPGRVWDIGYAGHGDPVAVFINSADHAEGNNLRYRYARWDMTKKQWCHRQIAFAGTRLYGQENNCAGGITLDPENPDMIYISCNVDPLTGNSNATGCHQIYRGRTEDNGKTWAWIQMTFDAQVDNLNPFIPRNHGHDICLLWLQGRYKNHEKFHPKIVGILKK